MVMFVKNAHSVNIQHAEQHAHSCWARHDLTLSLQAYSDSKQHFRKSPFTFTFCQKPKIRFYHKSAAPPLHLSTSFQKIYLSLLLFGQLLLQLLQLLGGAITQLVVGGRQLVQLSLYMSTLLWGQSGEDTGEEVSAGGVYTLNVFLSV